MFLAIDAGNSRTTFAVHDGKGWRDPCSLKTDPLRSTDEYAGLLLPLFSRAGLSPSEIEAIGVASVVPAADTALSELCSRYLGLKPFSVSGANPLPLRLNIEAPAGLGADRIANAAYAAGAMSLPAIVLDLGTGTTLDVITKGPCFEGGVIVPGIGMCLDALAKGTARLPLAHPEFPATFIGKSTVACVQAGVLYGYCDMLAGLIARAEAELGQKCSVAFTGGWSGLIRPHWKTAAIFEPTLTWEGIRRLWLWTTRTLLKESEQHDHYRNHPAQPAQSI